MSSGQPSVHLEDPDAARRPRGVVQRLFRGEEVFFHSMRTVADIMTSELECLRTGDTVQDAAELLGRRHVHHVPIIVDALSDDPSDAPTLAGLVSQRDIARALDPTQAAHPTPGEISGRSPLSRLMTRDLISVTAETKVTDAILLMIERKVDCLPVLNTTGQRGLQGIVTTTDVITSFLRMEALRKCRLGPGRNTTRSTLSSGRLIDALMGRVDDVMTTTLHELSPTDSVARAVEIIQDHRVRHVPVVDDQHRLLGVVTDRDIAALLPAPGPDREREPDRRGKFRARLFRIDNNDPRYAAALDTPVHRIMSPSPVAVAPGTPLVRLADLFSDTWLGYFPVVDRERSTLVGLVTQTDFLVGIMALSRLIQHGNNPPKRAASG
ncbi:MAG: CBS domain-containing protein [Nannocystaceae bacterium]|nr:CBS domain-containing protein [Nannocystaceae bacterium]